MSTPRRMLWAKRSALNEGVHKEVAEQNRQGDGGGRTAENHALLQSLKLSRTSSFKFKKLVPHCTHIATMSPTILKNIITI